MILAAVIFRDLKWQTVMNARIWERRFWFEAAEDEGLYVRLKWEPTYQPCDTQPPLFRGVGFNRDQRLAGAYLIGTHSLLSTGCGKALLFNIVPRPSMVEGEILIG
jgi:hypothetical protein